MNLGIFLIILFIISTIGTLLKNRSVIPPYKGYNKKTKSLLLMNEENGRRITEAMIKNQSEVELLDGKGNTFIKKLRS